MRVIEIESEIAGSEHEKSLSIAESIVEPLIRNSQPDSKIKDSLVYSSVKKPFTRPATPTKKSSLKESQRPFTPLIVSSKLKDQPDLQFSEDFFDPKWDEPEGVVPVLIKISKG